MSTTLTSNINECIQSHNFDALKEIGMKQGFADNNTTRLRSYSILLGCGGLDVYDVAGRRFDDKFNDEYTGRYTNLIGRDKGRNAYPHWNKTEHYSPLQKQFDLRRIATLIHITFNEHLEFNYLQSFDSVFAFFYLVTNGNLYIAERIIVSYLHIFRSDLSLSRHGFGHLLSTNYGLWALLKKYDSVYCKWLKSKTLGGDEDVSFVMEWYTSWFCHSSITDFKLLLRIYDFMISTQHQQIGLYMVISVLLVKKKELMRNVMDSGELIEFVNHKMEFDEFVVDQMIDKCHKIMLKEMKDAEKRNSYTIWKHIKKRSKALGIYL